MHDDDVVLIIINSNPRLHWCLAQVRDMHDMSTRRYKRLFLICTVVIVVYVFSTCTPNTSEMSTSIDLHQQQISLELVDAQMANMFEQTLESLVPNSTDFKKQPAPKKLLVRERVGLRWDLFPERYWETRVLPRISGHNTVLDVGANTGQFAIPIAELGNTVISLEPNEKTCNTLKNNVETRGLTPKVCPFTLFRKLFILTLSDHPYPLHPFTISP